MKPTTETEQPKQRRGFRCMTVEARTLIAAMGGRKTARKYGKGYMSAIGRAGRRKRTLKERRAKKEAFKGLKVATGKHPLSQRDRFVSSSGDAYDFTQQY